MVHNCWCAGGRSEHLQQLTCICVLLHFCGSWDCCCEYLFASSFPLSSPFFLVFISIYLLFFSLDITGGFYNSVQKANISYIGNGGVFMQGDYRVSPIPSNFIVQVCISLSSLLFALPSPRSPFPSLLILSLPYLTLICLVLQYLVFQSLGVHVCSWHLLQRGWATGFG